MRGCVTNLLTKANLESREKGATSDHDLDDNSMQREGKARKLGLGMSLSISRESVWGGERGGKVISRISIFNNPQLKQKNPRRGSFLRARKRRKRLPTTERWEKIILQL